MVMLFNVTFNNISVISWQSVLLVEKTGVPGEYIFILSNQLYKRHLNNNIGLLHEYW